MRVGLFFGTRMSIYWRFVGGLRSMNRRLNFINSRPSSYSSPNLCFMLQLTVDCEGSAAPCSRHIWEIPSCHNSPHLVHRPWNMKAQRCLFARVYA